MKFSQQWQCINKCPPFEAVATPSYCPHCASKELHALQPDDEAYQTRPYKFVNTNDG